MKITRNKHNFEFMSNREFNIKIKVTGYTPPRPAPSCSNPNSLRFSDCGDNSEWDDIDVFFVIDDVEIPMPDGLWKLIEDSFYEEIDDAAAEYNQAEHEAAMEFNRECAEGR